MDTKLMMKTYLFTVHLIGSGETKEEAWEDVMKGIRDTQIPEKDDIRELKEETTL